MKKRLDVPFQFTDNFTQSTIGVNDDKSCVVRALSTAFDIDYLIAFNILANNGRKYKRGTYRETTYKSITQLCELYGYEQRHFTVPVKLRASDIAIQNKDNKNAILLMFTKRHLTLLKNGKLHDTFVDNNFVTYFITLTKKSPDMATSIKNLTSEERSKLVQEISEKLSKDSFPNTKEKQDAKKLLDMLSRHKPADEVVAEEKPVIELTFKF